MFYLLSGRIYFASGRLRRCVIHQRASWALDKRELEALQHRARKHGLFVKDDTFAEAKAESFAKFKNRYINVTERISKSVVK